MWHVACCVSHIITRCSDDWNAMCAAWSQDNEIDQVCIRIGCLSFNDRAGPDLQSSVHGMTTYLSHGVMDCCPTLFEYPHCRRCQEMIPMPGITYLVKTLWWFLKECSQWTRTPCWAEWDKQWWWKVEVETSKSRGRPSCDLGKPSRKKKRNFMKKFHKTVTPPRTAFMKSLFRILTVFWVHM